MRLLFHRAMGCTRPGDRGSKPMRLFTKLKRDERGATAVEYGLILALIVLAMLTALTGLASKSVAMWNYVATTVVNN